MHVVEAHQTGQTKKKNRLYDHNSSLPTHLHRGFNPLPSATMFDIPELNELACRRLDTYDLAQCARVSKKWHTISTAYLWQDLTYTRMKTETLCQLILEDYLYEQQHQVALQGESNMEQHSSAPSTASLPSLTKYGMHVRWLPDPDDHELRMKLRAIVKQQALPGHSVKAKAHYLTLHLFKRCPAFKVRVFTLPLRYPDFSGSEMAIAENVLPRVQDLLIGCIFNNQHTNFQKLRELMDRCSDTLERLNVKANLVYNEHDSMNRTFNLKENEQSICWTSLKELNVRSVMSTNSSGPNILLDMAHETVPLCHEDDNRRDPWVDPKYCQMHAGPHATP